MASTINAKSTGSGGIDHIGDASGILGLQTGGVTAMTIDASQNIGISNTGTNTVQVIIGNGSASTAPQLYINGGTSGANGPGIYGQGAGSTEWLIASLRSATGGGATGMVDYVYGANPRVFYTNGSERMRIDSAGNVGIGTSSPNYKLDISSGNSNTLNITTNNTNTTIFNITRASVTTVTHTLDSTGYKIINGGSGGLYLGYTGTSWTSLSDERFKTDLKPIENAIDKVSTLRAVTGRFKTDEETKSRSFLIAQDIQEVLPEAVDASNPEQLGVSYTDTIPLLVAAIQELSAKVDAQQQEINALKGAV